MKHVTVKDLVNSIAGQVEDLSKKQISQIIELFINEVAKALTEGENVKLKNLGVFKVVTRAPRKVIPPGKDKPIEVPARKAIKFKVSSNLK